MDQVVAQALALCTKLSGVSREELVRRAAPLEELRPTGS